MRNLKIFIFNKLADYIFKITQSGYYKDKMTSKHLKNIKSVGRDCRIHPNSFIKNPQYISIGNHFYASWNLRIEAIDSYNEQIFTPILKIGNNVIFNTDVHIGCINNIEIGDNCLLASRIFISDHNHGDTSFDAISLPPSRRLLHSKGPVIIGENCWIGEGVAILPGVTIGKNSIIATNSVVTKDIPEYSIAAGIPAKIIKNIYPR